MSVDVRSDLTQGDVDRFWKYVDQRREDECWEWQSTVGKNGYGKFWLNGRTDRAHRVSFRINNGPIPDGALVRHSCDNKSCVNPRHLLTGTVLDNARDALDRGLYPRGVDNGRAKLTTQQVSEVRRRWASGETQVSIGRSFGVSKSTIQWILNGRNWAGIGKAS